MSYWLPVALCKNGIVKTGNPTLPIVPFVFDQNFMTNLADLLSLYFNDDDRRHFIPTDCVNMCCSAVAYVHMQIMWRIKFDNTRHWTINMCTVAHTAMAVSFPMSLCIYSKLEYFSWHWFDVHDIDSLYLCTRTQFLFTQLTSQFPLGQSVYRTLITIVCVCMCARVFFPSFKNNKLTN